MTTPTKFLGKVALITGSSAGIGEATAKLFAKHGASLAITGRNEENLKKVAEECKKLGAPDVLPIVAEFTKLEDIKKSFDMTMDRFSKLDILINNVGAFRLGNLESLSMEDFDYHMSINVKSAVYLTQIAMPFLVKAKGSIVNVSSLSSVRQNPGTILYGMAKAALDQFTKTVALEYAPKGVRVNSVNPSFVLTSITRDRGLTQEQAIEFYKNRHHHHPLGRCGEADEVANAIFFLASDTSAWTTGQCLILDGGRALTSL